MAGEARPALRRGWTTGASAASATITGKTPVEVAIVDRQGDFLARVGG